MFFRLEERNEGKNCIHWDEENRVFVRHDFLKSKKGILRKNEKKRNPI